MKRTKPIPGAPAHDARGLLVTRPLLAQLLRVSEQTIIDYANRGWLPKAGHGLYYLQPAVDLLIQLRQADVIVAGTLRNTKSEEEIARLRAQTELTRLEIDKAHREQLLQLTETDIKALETHARLLKQLAVHASGSLAFEIGVLLCGVPAFADWTNREIAEFATAWAEAWVEREAAYLLGPDGLFQDGECWKEALLPAREAAKPFDPLSGQPFWSSGAPDAFRGEKSECEGWWRWVPIVSDIQTVPRGRFVRLEGYAAPPPKSILRALMVKGKEFKNAFKKETER